MTREFDQSWWTYAVTVLQRQNQQSGSRLFRSVGCVSCSLWTRFSRRSTAAQEANLCKDEFHWYRRNDRSGVGSVKESTGREESVSVSRQLRVVIFLDVLSSRFLVRQVGTVWNTAMNTESSLRGFGECTLRFWFPFPLRANCSARPYSLLGGGHSILGVSSCMRCECESPNCPTLNRLRSHSWAWNNLLKRGLKVLLWFTVNICCSLI